MLKGLGNNKFYYFDEKSGYWTIATVHDENLTDGIIGGLALSEVYWKAEKGEEPITKFLECVKEYIESCEALDYEPEVPYDYEGI